MVSKPAGGGLEPVMDSGDGGHSVFARAFLKSLEENKVIIDRDSLFETIRRRVILNAEQTPVYSDIRFAGHDDGDFIFVPRWKLKIQDCGGPRLRQKCV
jgi:hypothetical protein